jgi:uncharacterized protein
MARLESLYSQQVTAMASDAISPGQVTGLVFQVQQGKVILNWNAVTTNSDASPIADLAGYKVYRKKNALDALVEVGQVAPELVTFEDSSIKDGTSYIYAVAAFDNEVEPNEGLKSDEVSVKTITSVPTGLVSSAFDSKIVLDWSSVKDIGDAELNENLAGYNVYRSEVSGTGYVEVGSVAADVETFEDLTVVNGTTYYYVVTSFDNSL